MINETVNVTHIPEYLNYLPPFITRYVGIGFYICGVIGALLNIYVFSQPAIRSNPCSLFLKSLSIVDLIQIHNSLLIRIAQFGFQWDPLIISPSLCKIRYYIGYICTTDFAVLATLASFERYGSTCKRNSRWRYLNKPSTACNIIISCVIITSFACCFVFFCYGIHNGSDCMLYKGFCMSFTMIYMFVIAGLVPPFFIILFGCLTLHKLRNLHRRSRAGPISYKTYTHIKEANEELTCMLLMQVLVMLISTFPYALFVIYHLSVRHMVKTVLQISWEKFIGHLIHLLFYVNFVSSAYINLMSSSMYRHYLINTHVTMTRRMHFGVEGITSALLSISQIEHK